MKSEGLPVSADFLRHTKEKVDRGMDLGLPITETELTEQCVGDPHCERALRDFLEYSTRYAADVWDMKLLMTRKDQYEPDEWKEVFSKADRERSQLHNALIDSIAILIRQLNRVEENTEWARSLMPTGTLERAYCGKFAIMLTYSRYVNFLMELEETDGTGA